MSLLLYQGKSIVAVVAPDPEPEPDPGGINTAPSVTGTIINDGVPGQAYDGFPWPVKLPDGSILTFWKRAFDHASGGPLMMGRSTDGGATWTKRQVTVGGVGVTNVSLGAEIIDNVVHINYQDDTTYQTLKFARINASEIVSNFSGCTFTSGGTVTLGTTAHSSAPF